jgi:hypothetical protein
MCTRRPERNSYNSNTNTRPSSKDSKIKNLEEKLEQNNKEADDWRHQLKLEKLAVTRFCHDDTLISFYTGFQSYDEFVPCNFQIQYSYLLMLE